MFNICVYEAYVICTTIYIIHTEPTKLFAIRYAFYCNTMAPPAMAYLTYDVRTLRAFAQQQQQNWIHYHTAWGIFCCCFFFLPSGCDVSRMDFITVIYT